jgi:hypothetical protein
VSWPSDESFRLQVLDPDVKDSLFVCWYQQVVKLDLCCIQQKAFPAHPNYGMHCMLCTTKGSCSKQPEEKCGFALPMLAVML